MLVSTGALPVLAQGQTTPPVIATIALVKLEYWHKDHLGSIAATTDHQGNVTARFAYDPFGKRRYTNGQYDAFGNLVVDWADNVNHGIDRGFTGHEHLDDLGLVHMNGRLYDPLIGRFLQGDPFIQAPDELQNYNRYSYCYNNPLNCTDPTGYFSLKKLFRVVVAIVVTYITYGAAAEYLAFTLHVGATGTAIGAGAISGFAGGAIATGTIKGALQGAFSGALFGAVGSAVGTAGLHDGNIVNAAKFAEAVALHGVAGCVSSVAGGGKCGPGALSAAFSKLTLPVTAGMKDGLERAFAHAIIGGTGSALGGGKFANGAITGAFSYLYNYCTRSGKCGTRWEQWLYDKMKALTSSSVPRDGCILANYHECAGVSRAPTAAESKAARAQLQKDFIAGTELADTVASALATACTVTLNPTCAGPSLVVAGAAKSLNWWLSPPTTGAALYDLVNTGASTHLGYVGSAAFSIVTTGMKNDVVRDLNNRIKPD